MINGSEMNIDLIDSPEALLKHLRNLVRMAVNMEVSGDDDKFYQLGMDSLQTLQLSRSLRSALASSQKEVGKPAPNFVYAHPTRRKLSEGLRNLHNSNAVHEDFETQINEMESILSQCSQMLLAKEGKSLPKSMRPTRRTIILTGSTGSLGSYLLDSLAARRCRVCLLSQSLG